MNILALKPNSKPQTLQLSAQSAKIRVIHSILFLVSCLLILFSNSVQLLFLTHFNSAVK
jgi:hypothetical protein